MADTSIATAIDAAEGSRPAIVSGGARRSYAELRNEIADLRRYLADVRCRGVAIQTARADVLIPWTEAARREHLPVVLAEPDAAIADLRLPAQLCSHVVRDHGLDTIPDADLEVATTSDASAEFVIQTSGTTGAPKLAAHTESGLLEAVVQKDSIRRKRWLLTYAPARFAGIQVWLHAMCNEGTLLAAVEPGFAPRAELLLRERPEIVSATPTFWLQLLRSTPRSTLTDLPIERITLGGEACNQILLDTLAAVWPQAQVAHIYASTEAGVGVTVRDGREGLPVDILTEGHQGREFSIEDGELHVGSTAGMRGYLAAPDPASVAGRLATGDLVEVVGDRILFRGRRNLRIHVAGFKVDPVEIENAALDLEGVVMARAYGRKNPILGELVALQFVPADADRTDEIEQAIRERFRDWPAHKQPRQIEAVASIETNDSGKVLR